ncbi:MAG: DUF4810 domain-containing protein [Alcaligenaceae bacterium]|nr:DUF4810 domain-containing protein [Alcaligenaceae bacterium]
MSLLKRHCLVLGSTLLLTACAAPKTAYYWGNYEPVVYHHFTNESSPDEQIAALEKDLATAKEKNLGIPPGLHAQLGLLYIQTGKEAAGFAQFQQEKSLFPESAHYLDFVLKPKARQPQTGTTAIASVSSGQANIQPTKK